MSDSFLIVTVLRSNDAAGRKRRKSVVGSSKIAEIFFIQLGFKFHYESHTSDAISIIVFFLKRRIRKTGKNRKIENLFTFGHFEHDKMW